MRRIAVLALGATALLGLAASPASAVPCNGDVCVNSVSLTFPPQHLIKGPVSWMADALNPFDAR
ncbi:hypothetical protein ACQUSR_30675 [Streptomyces sp. P1-3]|uniref:hypothetical protein n=1 Tax=Streptomyces sp. P1-3 TaxID=3421658 RepID=UPI003D369CFA